MLIDEVVGGLGRFVLPEDNVCEESLVRAFMAERTLPVWGDRTRERRSLA